MKLSAEKRFYNFYRNNKDELVMLAKSIFKDDAVANEQVYSIGNRMGNTSAPNDKDFESDENCRKYFITQLYKNKDEIDSDFYKEDASPLYPTLYYENTEPLTIEEREHWFDFTRNFFDNILSKVNSK